MKLWYGRAGKWLSVWKAVPKRLPKEQEVAPEQAHQELAVPQQFDCEPSLRSK